MADAIYIFGQPVCRDALFLLTRIYPYLLSQARDATLKGQRSVLSVHEVGMHARIRNHSKAPVYISARQWLDD